MHTLRVANTARQLGLSPSSWYTRPAFKTQPGDTALITIVLPAYNEEEALPPLLKSLVYIRETYLSDLSVIVVDDGSADATPSVVEASATTYGDWISLIQHPHNMGLSQGIQTGFRAALFDAEPTDIIVTLDADNTQPAGLIPRMVHLIDEGYDVVIASRYRPGARIYGVPFVRRLYSLGMSLLFRSVFPIRGVRDYSCGFRAYRAVVLQCAFDHYGARFVTEQGFACMVEILFQLDRLGRVVFGEVPLILRYDLKPTETKMKVSRTITDTLRLALRHRFGLR